MEIDDLNYHTRMIQSRNERSFYVREGANRKFPYIMPFVCFEQGLFKIVIERVIYTDEEYRSTNVSERRRESSRGMQGGKDIEESLLTVTNSAGKKMLLER